MIEEELKCKLGFGTLRLPKTRDNKIDIDQLKSLVDTYYLCGGNYFETAYSYHGSEVAMRKSVVERFPRESYLIADKMPSGGITSRKEYDDIFFLSLKLCGVDYFDCYLLHNINKISYITTEKLGGFEWLAEKKKRGLVKYIGFSFHDTAELLDQILDKYASELDFVQLQINYMDWESIAIQSHACYSVARKHNLPIFVMEPNKGGLLITGIPDKARKEILQAGDFQSSLASVAMRWVAGKDGIINILSGMKTVSEVKENIESVKHTLNFEENEAVNKAVGYIFADQKVQCTNCRYCVNKCPRNIPIPELFALYNSDNVHSEGGMYKQITFNKGKASECIKCGACENICSQRLPIRSYLENIACKYENNESLLYKCKIKIVKFLKKFNVYYCIKSLKGRL